MEKLQLENEFKVGQTYKTYKTKHLKNEKNENKNTRRNEKAL